MTSVAVDWVNLSTPEFVGWTKSVKVRLPFPLNAGSQPYIATPAAAEIDRMFAERHLDDSPVLHAARSAFTDPRLLVYAVRGRPDGTETKYCAVSGRDDGAAVLVLLDETKVALRRIADTELAAGVIGALPVMRALQVPVTTVPAAGLEEVEAAVASGVSPRTMHTQMSHLGMPEGLIALHERSDAAAVPSGVIGALAFVGSGEPRHSTRSAAWREFDEGVLLHLEGPTRHGEATVVLTPATQDALFRAAVDAVSSAIGGG